MGGRGTVTVYPGEAMSKTKCPGLWVVNFLIFRKKKNTFNNSSKKTVHEKKICPAEWVDKLT